MSGDILAATWLAGRSLMQSEIDWLVKTNGVPSVALGWDPGLDGFVVKAANVAFAHRSFDINAEGQTALIFAARDSSGDVVDVVAWQPRDGQVATLLGRVSMLGEHVPFGPIGGPVSVCATPLEWLQAGRTGVVIIDADRAGRVLIDAPAHFACADEKAAKNLAAIMTRPCRLGRIVVPTRRAA